MSESEIVIRSEAGVKAYNGEHPPSVGLKAGAFADVGTIILTNKRFAYINKGGSARAAAWVLGGAFVGYAVEKTASQAELNELSSQPGSYSIPLQEIVSVQTARHMGSAYLRIDSRTPGIAPSHSYILGSGFSKNEDWVTAINNTINAPQNQQNYSSSTYSQNPTSYPPPPPPPPPATPTCPTCGNQLTYITQYQRWYCYREQKYV